MSDFFIEHATVYTPHSRLDDATLLIARGRIAEIALGGELPHPADAPRIDAADLLVAPGLIDLQLNGAFGDDFTAHPETIWRVAAQLPRYGITSFLPTIVTSPVAQVDAARRVLEHRPQDFRGAEPLGLHLEGPFLNPYKKGAHNPTYLQAPNAQVVADWSPATGVRLVTLAPELPNARAVIETLVNTGVVVSAGHSMATLEQAQAGFDAGIRYATHLFNAMPPLDHRAPGLVGAVLSNKAWIASLIPDGIHVHPALVKLVWELKGPHGLTLVSDAMAALGMRPGTYPLNDLEVVVGEDAARLRDGTLAGCVLALDEVLRNFIAFTDVSLADALATVTATPARVLGIERERGAIAPGMIADLVLLTPDLQVHTTIAAGEIVYQHHA